MRDRLGRQLSRDSHFSGPVLQQHIELILPVGLVDQVVAGVVE
jgi:hypothetical protein